MSMKEKFVANDLQVEKKALLPAVFVPEDKTYEISLRSPYGDSLGIETARQEMLIGMIRALAYQSFSDNKFQEAADAIPEAEQLKQLNGSRFRGDTINRLRGTSDFEPEQWYKIIDDVAYPCEEPSILRDPDELETEEWIEEVSEETRYPDTELRRGNIKHEYMHQTFGKKRRKQIRDKGRAAKKARRANRK